MSKCYIQFSIIEEFFFRFLNELFINKMMCIKKKELTRFCCIGVKLFGWISVSIEKSSKIYGANWGFWVVWNLLTNLATLITSTSKPCWDVTQGRFKVRRRAISMLARWVCKKLLSFVSIIFRDAGQTTLFLLLLGNRADAAWKEGLQELCNFRSPDTLSSWDYQNWIGLSQNSNFDLL